MAALAVTRPSSRASVARAALDVSSAAAATPTCHLTIHPMYALATCLTIEPLVTENRYCFNSESSPPISQNPRAEPRSQARSWIGRIRKPVGELGGADPSGAGLDRGRLGLDLADLTGRREGVCSAPHGGGRTAQGASAQYRGGGVGPRRHTARQQRPRPRHRADRSRGLLPRGAPQDHARGPRAERAPRA